MRVVYLGTSTFAAAVLDALAHSRFRPALVITPPDARRGRGRRLAPPPAAVRALELGLDLAQTDDVSTPAARERIAAAKPDLGCVCAFGQLIREPLLSELELLNVHPSLLPRWRGAAPIERAIEAGDERTGVTIMRVTAGLDSGPIALAEAAEIGGRSFGELAPELERLGGRLLVRALELRESGRLELSEQDDSLATYAEKIRAEERRLDPQRPAIELERKVRALTPHVGAYLELEDGGRLGVRAAELVEGDAPNPGTLVGDGGDLVLGCGAGTLRIVEVQPAGKRPMAADAYLRGHELPRLAIR